MRHSFLSCFFTFFAILALSGCGASAPHNKGDQANDPRESAEVHVQLGQRYMEQGKLELALEKLQKALKYDPSFPDAHTVIAVLYERINDPKNAEEHYRRAAELAPKNGAVNNNYGTFLCKLGKLDQAAKYFDRAIADPFYKTLEVAYTNAGTCLLLNGNLDKAEANFRKALEINPSNGESLIQLASILYKKNDNFHARAFLQRYESLGQSSPSALGLGREIELKLGNADAARDYAERLRSQYPDSQQARGLDLEGRGPSS